jgi:glyoxylase-like metal-dependent hydrolase (beta-lactamase superfamily II)
MKLTPILCGYFKLDGGAMFGVVPKRLWAALNPPDDQNLCTWAMRALLVQTEGRNILIDTGIGNKQDDKFRSHFLPHGEESLFSSLKKAGLAREDITDVLLTHLHFDHCGGALWRNETSGNIELSFPNAHYWTNKRHYEWACQPNERERASFLKENFQPLQEMGQLRFIETRQGISWIKDIRIRFFYGHTEAMMAPEIKLPDGRTLLYCADALPARWHIPMPYVMAYDIRPLQTLREKAAMLERAVRKRQLFFLEHDPVAECASVRLNEQGRIVLDKAGKLSEFLS